MPDTTKKLPYDILDEDLNDSAKTEHSLVYAGDIKSPEQLKAYIEEVRTSVQTGVKNSIDALTPWFFSSMPRIYYQTTPRVEKVKHLTAIITSHLFETKQTLVLWEPDRSKVNFIGPGGDSKELLDMSLKINDLDLKMGSLYLSLDRKLFVSSFFSSEYQNIDASNSRILEKLKQARDLINQEFPADQEQVEHYFKHLDNDFVMYATAGRIQLTYRMLRHMLQHESGHTSFEAVPDRPTARVTLGLKNASASEILEQVLNLVSRYGVVITRFFMVRFTHGYEKPITIVHFHIASQSELPIDTSSLEMKKLNKALRTLGWVDRDEYSHFLLPQYNFSINASNLMRSIGVWINVMLGKHNPYYFSHYKIRSTFFSHSELSKEIVSLFRFKFDPMHLANHSDNTSRNTTYVQLRDELNEKIAKIVDEIERKILSYSVQFVDHVQKTNYFLNTKTGLAFRISPDILDPKFYPEKPFSIFYMVGRDYRMFHTRWKDIARGGLRVVMPKTPSDYDFALSGIYDEVYGLSYAQQLKNKDIPEGGAKGVLLLKPSGDRIQAVRNGVNAFLDLLVREDETHEERSDANLSYYEKDDIIYLGPDENITNDLIEWIPEQAKRRGYPYAAAFMSSKPSAGINHKQYGVTSEGLNVYVENMLRFLGIDPRKQTFTVKITGGPDGDVAGNELNILQREYGEHARVVAIGDGFGAAFDPKGLAWSELIRLFKAGLPISEFNKTYLSGPTAFVIKADTAENIKIRNELHAKIPSDILLPCGGRPYTVNDKSWPLFLDSNNKPSCRAVVEGANIFFTKEARQKLQENGVLFIKDSTANKTGVICSSYEIIASLTISEKEFLEIKEVYVKQVIDILRQKADAEAKLLFREYARSSGTKTLVDLSMDISLEINAVTDALLAELTKRQDEVFRDDLFQNIIFQHCPAILVEKFRERITSKLPQPHKIAILAAFMASRIVYKEGLGWLAKLSDAEKFRVAVSYMRNEVLTQELMKEIQNSGIPNKDKILSILSMSSTRDLTLIG